MIQTRTDALSWLRRSSQDGYTALISAAAYGHADCVRLLIDAGANKEAKNGVRASRCFAGYLLGLVYLIAIYFHLYDSFIFLTIFDFLFRKVPPFLSCPHTLSHSFTFYSFFLHGPFIL